MPFEFCEYSQVLRPGMSPTRWRENSPDPWFRQEWFDKIQAVNSLNHSEKCQALAAFADEENKVRNEVSALFHHRLNLLKYKHDALASQRRERNRQLLEAHILKTMVRRRSYVLGCLLTICQFKPDSFPPYSMGSHSKPTPRQSRGRHPDPFGITAPIPIPSSPAQLLYQTQRSITFEALYQNGDAADKHMIVQHPATSQWVILCCDHFKIFGINPIRGAVAHLRGGNHSPLKTGADALRHLSIHVEKCNSDKADQNNKIFLKTLGHGNKPFNYPVYSSIQDDQAIGMSPLVSI